MARVTGHIEWGERLENLLHDWSGLVRKDMLTASYRAVIFGKARELGLTAGDFLYHARKRRR